MTTFADLGLTLGLASPDVQAAVAVAVAHTITLAGWGLRLRWQARHAHRHREDMLAILRELPDGSRVQAIGTDGSVLRIDLPDADRGRSVNDDQISGLGSDDGA